MITITDPGQIPAAVAAIRKNNALDAIERLRGALAEFNNTAARQKHAGETLEEKADRRNRAVAYRHALAALSKVEGLFSIMSKGF